MQVIIKKFNELTLKELYEIIKLRIDVFSIEQNCIYQDLDDEDYHATHIFLTKENDLLTYLRVINIDLENKSARIGRVVSKTKANGLGTLLMTHAVRYLKDDLNINKINVSAQTIALNFYKRLGFKITSQEYLIDNINHFDMELVISNLVFN